MLSIRVSIVAIIASVSGRLSTAGKNSIRGYLHQAANASTSEDRHLRRIADLFDSHVPKSGHVVPKVRSLYRQVLP